MNTNPIDTFRNNFFEKLLKEEKEKEQAKLLTQKQCFHQYSQIGPTYHSDRGMYQERTCIKCEHSDIRLMQVWEGTKRGTCLVM